MNVPSQTVYIKERVLPVHQLLPAHLALSRDPQACLDQIWHLSFADVPRMNMVEIASARPWKRRLGCICLSEDTRISRITLNALLQHPEVPIAVLVITISHELAHYAHGFGSPLPRQFPHPHANGVVTRELEKRG